MPLGTLFIDPEWYRSVQGRQIMASLMDRNNERRRVFGLLEKPAFAPGSVPEVFEYKLFVSGKFGVGKTAAVAKLTANKVPNFHSETPGIQVTTTYWPAVVTEVNRLVLFKLNFWDAGDTAIQKFDHILPACKHQMDAVLFFFSFNDKSSFKDLPLHIRRVLNSDENLCRFVVGTKLDLQSECQVTRSDVEDFETRCQLKVVCLKNIFGNIGCADVDDVATVLNFICDQLWQRDRLVDGESIT